MSLKEYWQPEINENYIGKKCTIVCSDFLKINKITEGKWELRCNYSYDLKTFPFPIIEEKNKPKYIYYFSPNKEVEGLQKITLEGHDFIYDTDSNSFINKEEFEVDINSIRKSKIINDIIDKEFDISEKIPVNVSPKIMKIIIKFLEYNIQPYHKIYEHLKPIKYNNFQMNINNYDNDVLGEPSLREEVRKWYTDFVNSFSRFERRDIIDRSYYLDLPELTHLFCLEYSMWFKTQTFEELVEQFNIPKEVSEEALKKGSEEIEKIKNESKEKESKEKN